MAAKFVWYDLNTKDKAAAQAFYQGLFGWGTEDWKPEGAPDGTPPYAMITIDGQSIGGVNELPADAPAPSHWLGHVRVEDLDAAMARAKARGATFPMGAMDIPTVGRMAIMIDPQGCAVSLFTPAGDMPPGPEPSDHGMVGWNELIAEDPAAAKAFYTDVVGWTWRDGPFQEQMEYYLFGSGAPDGDAGGMAKKAPEMPVSTWLLYFTTRDIAETAAKVESLGGAVHAAPFEVPSVGKLAVCAGPDGAMFGLAEWDMRSQGD